MTETDIQIITKENHQDKESLEQKKYLIIVYLKK